MLNNNIDNTNLDSVKEELIKNEEFLTKSNSKNKDDIKPYPHDNDDFWNDCVVKQ